MKIVIPVLRFGRSGGERVISKLATGLIKYGHDVLFVIADGSGQPYYDTKARVLTYEPSKSKVVLFRWISNYCSMLNCCKSVNADVIIATYHQMAYVAIMLPRRTKKLYYIQAYEANFFSNIFKKSLAMVTYLLPLKRVVNSELILPRFLNDFIACVPAGIDFNLFYGKRDLNFDCSKKINIGIIGRVEQYKGTRESLDAICDYIMMKNLDGRVTVNVAIHLPPEYISKGIVHHEITNDNQLAKFYKLNDIVIAAGLVEFGAFHYPCAEAMAAGCLTISNYAPLTKTNSTLKMIGYSKEQIIERLDYAVRCIKNNESLSEISRNQEVMMDYSWESICSKFNNVINNI